MRQNRSSSLTGYRRGTDGIFDGAAVQLGSTFRLRKEMIPRKETMKTSDQGLDGRLLFAFGQRVVDEESDVSDVDKAPKRALKKRYVANVPKY